MDSFVKFITSLLFAAADGILFWAANHWYQRGYVYVASAFVALGIASCVRSCQVLNGRAK